MHSKLLVGLDVDLGVSVNEGAKTHTTFGILEPSRYLLSCCLDMLVIFVCWWLFSQHSHVSHTYLVTDLRFCQCRLSRVKVL